MTMSPEAKFNAEIWTVLQEIKKKSFYRKNGEPISYYVNGSIKGFSVKTEKDILEKLKSWDVIKLQKPPGISEVTPMFDIEMIYPKFGQMYQLIGNCIKNQVDQEYVFRMMQELAQPLGKDTNLSFDIWKLSKKDEDVVTKEKEANTTSRTIINIQLIYDLSPENRKRIKRFIEIIQNQIELQGFSQLLKIVKMPFQSIERDGYNAEEIKILADKLNKVTDKAIIGIHNEIIDGRFKEQKAWLVADQFGIVNESNHKDVLTGISEKDLKSNLIIGLASPAILQDIKRHIDDFERRLVESNPSSDQKAQAILTRIG